MSKKRAIFEIYPEHLSPGGRFSEMFISDNHKCCYCQGNGWFWGRDDVGENIKEPCPICKGSGMLRAIVTIKWGPSQSFPPPNSIPHRE